MEVSNVTEGIVIQKPFHSDLTRVGVLEGEGVMKGEGEC